MCQGRSHCWPPGREVGTTALGHRGRRCRRRIPTRTERDPPAPGGDLELAQVRVVVGRVGVRQVEIALAPDPADPILQRHGA